MQLGMVGLGKMGANMTKRLLLGGHQMVVMDLNPLAVQAAVADGAIGAVNLDDLISKLDTPRAVWVMVPAGAPTENTIQQLSQILAPGDIVIDGGNSYYKDSQRRGVELATKQIHFVDVGTSGGIWGLESGYSMMIGGDPAVVESLRPLFETFAPVPDRGWGYVGTHGAGHFVKMIHNGIEYGMMQAFAEGLSILRAKGEYGFDLAEITRIWQDGSVIRSWLLDLTHMALTGDQQLEQIAAFVPDSGEGRWTVFEAIDLNVSAPVITTSLERRIRSREDGYTDKLLAVMRNMFGGHAVFTQSKPEEGE
ncbi:MAG: decarboxylating 6-phosphogluconate dehydrogenase [Anaerolineae bacterium]|jgi:6-phosphogluconate dehydrogenase|nr:decarboxylating 6-phosphogluconate dehydrogenase [Anaerolineae bacterium]